MNIRKEVAAATAIVGYNLIDGEQLERVNYPRTLVGVALVGSTTAGDCAVEVYVGTTRGIRS